MRKADHDEINQAITSGIVFKGAKLKTAPKEEKVKNKDKKKTYITGQQGSGAAKHKAQTRASRANRQKSK